MHHNSLALQTSPVCDRNRFAMLRLHLNINKLTNTDVTALIPTTSFLQNIHSTCIGLATTSAQQLVNNNHIKCIYDCYTTGCAYNNNNDRLTASDQGQPG